MKIDILHRKQYYLCEGDFVYEIQLRLQYHIMLSKLLGSFLVIKPSFVVAMCVADVQLQIWNWYQFSNIDTIVQRLQSKLLNQTLRVSRL